MVPTIERVTNLLALLLERRERLSLRDIVHELAGQYPESPDAQRAAFERDKATLREIGVPIETAVESGDRAGQTVYWIDRDRYELRGLELADDERQALQTAVAIFRSDVGQAAVWKLGGAVLPSSPLVATGFVHLSALAELRTALAARAVVSFTYRGVRRRLDPYGLLLRRGFWYVIGRDHQHDELRTYRVDRIEGSVSAGEPAGFERPVDFDPRAQFPADPRRLGEGDEPEWAVVAIYGPVAAVVRREAGEDAIDTEPRADGSPGANADLVLRVPCANVAAFRSWVLGLGPAAEVLEPPEMRAAIVDWLQATIERAAS